MFRRPRPVDPLAAVVPDSLPTPWAIPLHEMVAARNRLRDLVAGATPGPLATHVGELVDDVDTTVLDAWQLAVRGQQLAATVAHLDVGAAGDDLKAAKRRLADLTARASQDPTSLDDAAHAVERAAERFASANRLRNELEDTPSRLAAAKRELETVVGIAAELVLLGDPGRDPAAGAAALRSRLGAVRDALAELG